MAQYQSYPGVVAGEHFLCYRCYVLQQELMPFLLIVNLIHVDVDGGDVLVAALDSVVLKNKESIRKYSSQGP